MAEDPEPADGTTIWVKSKTWKRLLMRKEPGDTFEDVVSGALDELEECQEQLSELDA